MGDMKTKVLFGVACAALLFTTMAGHFVARAQSLVTIQGIAFCYHNPVVGVWIASTNSGSGWSDPLIKISGDGHIVGFHRDNMVVPANISIHVGCGGTPQNWWSDNHTPDIGVSQRMILKVYVNDVASGTTYNSQFVPSAEAAAFDWAEPYYGQQYDVDKCLTFVSDAYKAANIDIMGLINVPKPSGRDYYPSDVWPKIAAHQVHGQVSTDASLKNPPAGSLVFFMPNPGYDYTWSHVAISKGGGQVLTTGSDYTPTSNKLVHVFNIVDHDKVAYNHYVGWWLPDQ
jgi:hypothetical protein